MSSTLESPPDQLAIALARLTPAVLCTLCVVELELARAAGQPDPEVLPGVVISEIQSVDGRTMIGALCEVRHPLVVTVQPRRSLLVASADALPPGGPQ